MSETELQGACGLFCGACYHYRAAFPESRHLLETALRQGQPPEGFLCQGCRSDRHYVHPGCAACAVRACADQRQIAHCGLCPDLPCLRLMAFQNDGREHHRDVLANLQDAARIDAAHWLQDQALRWTCRCGASFSWYETSCAQCGAALESYGPP
jgi:hypothetical protein